MQNASEERGDGKMRSLSPLTHLRPSSPVSPCGGGPRRGALFLPPREWIGRHGVELERIERPRATPSSLGRSPPQGWVGVVVRGQRRRSWPGMRGQRRRRLRGR